ncbi:MAG: polysaccharide export protein [Alphaproteobacteria bacterium]|nr:polysaccharide export protein [Alphaproteobacteria bacterium]
MRLFKLAISVFLIVFAATALSACADDDFMSVAPKDPGERALGGPAASVAAYRMSVGDKVRVTVFGTTPLINEYTIDETGSISIAPMGPIVVKNTTPAEAADLIAKDYAQAGLYRDPKVTVDVLTYGPFYMLGEVTKPGEFQYRPGMSLFAAVASAGGYTYRANRGRVFIRRANEAVETEYDLDSDIAILPGDVIRVPELHL